MKKILFYLLGLVLLLNVFITPGMCESGDENIGEGDTFTVDVTVVLKTDLEISWADNVGIDDSISILVDGHEIGTATTGGATETISLFPGVYTVGFRCNDSGNGVYAYIHWEIEEVLYTGDYHYPWQVVTIPIDIKFGSYPNSINLRSKNGVTPVAVFGSEDFDVTDIDPSTVMFAGVSPARWSIEDLPTEPNPLYGLPETNPLYDPDAPEFIGDGFDDIVFHFNTPDLRSDNEGDLDGASTEATLTGKTFDGYSIEGTDSVEIIKY